MAQDDANDFKVAVVGMACLLPKAPNVADYWKALLGGVDLLTHFSRAEIASFLRVPVEKIPQNLIGTYGLIAEADCFDHRFFGLSALEALRLDPQQRVFLQTSWHALENAGCDPARYPGRIGVFAGSGTSDHFHHLKQNADKLSGASDWELRIDTAPDFLASRVAFRLGLTGPAVTVQTACSTSLVAIHLAVQSLLAGDSDMVLAGGVTLVTDPTFHRYQSGGIIAQDGVCRPFDAKANGTVGASGCGVVALKLLRDAIEARDHIYCVIAGSSVNNDGSAKMSFSSPSLAGQREAVARAIECSGIDPNSVGFIETHGTGTLLGDPIEVASLRQAYQMTDDADCLLGSVKSNLGHTDTAAGVCGFIKAALSVYHGVVPPTIHFETPNPNLELDTTSFRINTQVESFPTGADGIRRAAVNSLGLGGTNAHVILEQFVPQRVPMSEAERELFFPVSANGPRELGRALNALAAFVRDTPEKLANIATTLQSGRRDFPFRRCLTAKSAEELVRKIDEVRREPRATAKEAAKKAKVCFVFPGQGGQYPGMARALYEESPIFRETADRCLAAFEALGLPLRSVLWTDTGGAAIHSMRLAQASVFTVEVSLAFHFQKLLGSPVHALLGHSLGAYAAASLAGVFSVEDACRIVHARGTLFERLEEGAMLAVLAAEREISGDLPESLSIAAVNGPSQIVVSGRAADIAAFAAALKRRAIECKEIHVSRAAHSAMLDPYLPEFEQLLEGIAFHPPRLPVLSDHTGDWAKPEELMSPKYWASHLRHVVRFSECLEKLLPSEEVAVLELGPGKTLLSLVSSHPSYRGQVLSQTVPHVREDQALRYDKHALALAWEAGAGIRWPASSGRRVPLPGYPFAKHRFNILKATPIEIEPEGEESPGASPESSDPVIRDVIALFSELLGEPNVGEEDSFFDLGGDSLLALRLFRLVRDKFKVDFALELIFRLQTPKLLAEEVKRLLSKEVRHVS